MSELIIDTLPLHVVFDYEKLKNKWFGIEKVKKYKAADKFK